ncbi:hypothetical protein C7S18_23700 (plasmid) [Ahniella affigens]|uniref:Uncharacterized protein n=1 Tax=Ahniella affigens TaxID=2021234 RepID=A0A2P1PZR1_9GAMM|nr:hypothetical protein [Ahniella affigens]AVQ00305.1 hypothetical protein C7S18_23700 [Ahniella affigens]
MLQYMLGWIGVLVGLVLVAALYREIFGGREIKKFYAETAAEVDRRLASAEASAHQHRMNKLKEAEDALRHKEVLVSESSAKLDSVKARLDLEATRTDLKVLRREQVVGEKEAKLQIGAAQLKLEKSAADEAMKSRERVLTERQEQATTVRKELAIQLGTIQAREKAIGALHRAVNDHLDTGLKVALYQQQHLIDADQQEETARVNEDVTGVRFDPQDEEEPAEENQQPDESAPADSSPMEVSSEEEGDVLASLAGDDDLD